MVDRDKSTTPTFSEQEQRHFMTAALEESRMALPGCLPNPPVGCVIVRGAEVVARGYTGTPERRTLKPPRCPRSALRRR